VTASYRHPSLAEGRVTEPNESLVESARLGSGIATVYRALDELVERYSLDDAAVVVDVPGLGRQVLHAGRRPLEHDPSGWHGADPGLYFDPPRPDDAPEPDAAEHEVLADLMVALGTLGLRHDALTDEPVTDEP
jgi:hypothetical protein